LKILITGGCGFLGGRLARLLGAGAEHEIVIGTRGASPVSAPVPSSQIVMMDWSSDSSLQRACLGAQAVVHLAGMNARNCARDPVGALEFNGLGTARLIRAAVRERTRRFLYVSTAHVYGAALCGAVDEHTCVEPRHPYATSRLAAEHALSLAHAATDIDACIVRLSNAFGVPADPAAECWSLLVNDLCLQAARTRKIALATRGTQRRDFIPMAEACRAIAHLLTMQPQARDQLIVNVGGNWAPTVGEMAGLVAARSEAVLGIRPELTLGSGTDAVGSSTLHYKTERLAAAGFEPRHGAAVEELDELLRFCRREDSAIPA
jgi:UDP-glucose 4-epimerase